MFNIYLGIYIAAAILIGAGGAYKLFSSNMSIAAVLFLIGAIAIFITFGLKWFKKGAMFSDTPVSWPPQINTCPDYLVYYSRSMPDGTKQDTCIDTIGISKNGSLKVFPKNGPAPTTDEYYFSLTSTSTDPAGKNQALCQKAIAMGLTWEGITNGESCITPAGPVAPSGGGNGGGGCPAF
jgi:hypothetical protein